jgi:4-amino-4-deoxy-L-arabinose transferase-like glycosyltransferase
MKPVRLPAAATLALPRWALYALGLLYILPGLIGRDPWKDDAGSFGIMWTMAHGTWQDWLLPNIAGLPSPEEGPLAFWLGAISIKLFGWLVGDVLGARISTIAVFALGTVSLWRTAFRLGRRAEAQPLRLAFGGQPEPDDYGRTLADTAVLIYLGCLGLLLQSHETLAVTLQGSLLAWFLHRSVRFVEAATTRNAVTAGIALGALTLTRGFASPIVLLAALCLCIRFLKLPVKPSLRSLATIGGTAVLVALVWILPAWLAHPYGQAPAAEWLDWNMGQLSLPTWFSLKAFFRVGIWYFWPAWPFAAWSAWAWRRQQGLPHIILPTCFVSALALLILFDPVPENGDLLKLLPPMALMAAFGLPTMKRGAINGVDWFSVMVLTLLGTFVWGFWIAKLTGRPAWMAKNALKLVPGFHPEFGLVAFVVALAATVGWIVLVHWRLSRQPSVLWRAVVLSSGGLILLWVLLTTLFLPELNYSKSYAGVAQQIAARLPADTDCIDTNVGPAQRASFAYFGHLPFAGVEGSHCSLLLLQDSLRKSRAANGADNVQQVTQHGDGYLGGRQVLPDFHPADWTLLWEGRRPSDRDERFRLFRRVR